MGSIDWGKLPNQPEFDKVVEAFFVKENSDLNGDAYAVNGRGGDAGIDIHLRRDGRLTIVQLKFFPEGFSGGWKKTRHQQILDSFKSALRHAPDEWWLVVPTTLTAEERQYVVGLPDRQHPKPALPKVVVFDRPELDILAAKHPDLVSYFSRDELLEAAKVYNQESALMIDQGDVLERVAALSRQAETLDPDWRLDVFTKGDMTGTILAAKHPQAAERSPVTLTLNASFGPDQEELRQKLDRVMSYGTPDRVDLPASVVSKFIVDGPAFIAHTSTNVEVSWIPATPESVGRRFDLVIYDKARKPIASFPGKTTWTGRAAVGASVHAEFFNVVTLKFLLPFEQTSPGSVGIDMSFAGKEPSDVVRAVTLLERLESEHSIGLELEGADLARLLKQDQAQSLLGESRDQILVHKAIAADLVVVQDATSRFFPYPEEIDAVERIYLRCLRLIVEGQCVVMPGKRQVSPTLNGKDGAAIRQILSGETKSLIVEMEDFGCEIFDQQIYIGPVRIYAPRVAAQGGRGLIKAFDAGTAEGRELVIRAEEGYGFWVFSPERFIALHGGDASLRPRSLGLPDVPDAPDVARAIDSSSE